MQCRLFYCIMENEQRGMITFVLAVCGNVDYIYTFPQSPPSRAAWIEIFFPAQAYDFCMSPPSRAAWIEMYTLSADTPLADSRRLHGRRGLKLPPRQRELWQRCRRLHGRRGLKWRRDLRRNATVKSPPSRAAWIEICSRKARV